MCLQKSGIIKKMSAGITYKQRDIVLMPFPYTDLTAAKKRPALIVSNNSINSSEDRICCLITSKESFDGLLLDELEGSLPLKSWVKPHRIFTINKKIIMKKLCSITPRMYEKVLMQIHEHLKEES